MSKSSHFVEGFVLGIVVSAIAAWFYCCDSEKRKCVKNDDDGSSSTRTKDLINQTRDAIDKGFDKLAKMAEARGTDAGKQGA